MVNEFQDHHKILFASTSVSKLGKIHCVLLAADNLLEKKSRAEKTESSEEFDLTPLKLTLFGRETAGNFINWWVRKNVSKLGEIKTRIEGIIPHFTELKRSSLKLEEKSSANSYQELIIELRNFAEQHIKEIDEIYSFVLWLHGLDELAPCVLFTHPPWSTSQLSVRHFKVKTKCNEIQEHRAIEIVFGLWSNGPTLAKIRNEMEYEWAESVDPENRITCPITFQKAFRRASKKILNEFTTYFEKVRDSVELIQSELLSFSREEILGNEEFLRLFIQRVLPIHRLESSLWDFKKTVPAWHNPSCQRLKLDFACNVASFANFKGGLLIIGISDNREILGVSDTERRIRQSRSIMETYFAKPLESIDIFSLPIKDTNGNLVNCIVVKTPQTKKVIEVKESPDGRKYLFPVRRDDGIEYKSYKQIEDMKRNVADDNFNFAKEIVNLVYYGT